MRTAALPCVLLVRLAALLVPLMALAPGCAQLGAWRVLRACPDSLARPEQVPVGFRREGSYRARTGDAETVLRVVLARRDDTLVAVGLTAIGAEAFHAVQRGDALDVEAPLAPWLGTPAALVVRDLHRIHFDALLPAAPGVTRSDHGPGVRIVRPACAHRADWEPAR